MFIVYPIILVLLFLLWISECRLDLNFLWTNLLHFLCKTQFRQNSFCNISNKKENWKFSVSLQDYSRNLWENIYWYNITSYNIIELSVFWYITWGPCETFKANIIPLLQAAFFGLLNSRTELRYFLEVYQNNSAFSRENEKILLLCTIYQIFF